MLSSKFGIEIEMTGITREKAAAVAADLFGGSFEYRGGTYSAWVAFEPAPSGRAWKFMYDSSIAAEKKQGRRVVSANDEFKCELVSPPLTYAADIEILQELVRRLRSAGALVNSSCGIHVHLDGAPHSVRSITNFIKIVASKDDLLYKALQVEPGRMTYCKKTDERLVATLASKKPKTMSKLEDLWYSVLGNYDRSSHYHRSRYHFLNLHSFFNGSNKTVELRGFNSTLHAGQVRSFVVLALALNHQALTQKSASAKKPQVENEKFAMRTYLNRIGLIGEQFANCREHLCKHLDGCAAWRLGSREATPRRVQNVETVTVVAPIVDFYSLSYEDGGLPF